MLKVKKTDKASISYGDHAAESYAPARYGVYLDDKQVGSIIAEGTRGYMQPWPAWDVYRYENIGERIHPRPVYRAYKGFRQARQWVLDHPEVFTQGNPSGNHTYCRLLLKEVMADVRKLVPGSTIKAAWPYIYPSKKEMKQAEFQIPPEKFYWNGQACCKASAAYQGWRSYLRKKGLATNPGKNRISKKASGGLSFGLMVGIGFIIYAIVKGKEE